MQELRKMTASYVCGNRDFLGFFDENKVQKNIVYFK